MWNSAADQQRFRLWLTRGRYSINGQDANVINLLICISYKGERFIQSPYKGMREKNIR